MKRLITTITFCFLAGILLAQNVKYKDLYPLLSVQKYDQAEPFLKQFLQDEKNAEKYPNALLQMAFIFEDKARNNDVLTETFEFQNHADSALSFYSRALKSIDDREVRKNDEYYQAYKRRDIRTGKFGIKLGDVQFDIETKIKDLKTRKENVKNLALYFHKSKDAYDSANGLYVKLKEKYPTEKRLLLRLDDSTKATLNAITTNYDVAVERFDKYENALKGVGKTGYNQNLSIVDITDYDKEGNSASDLLKDEVKFWNYAKWADGIIKTHDDEILPLFGSLIAFDQQLEDLGDQLARDSTSIANTLPSIDQIASLATLKKYDPNPMPTTTFRYKIQRLKYHALGHQHANYLDSADVIYQMNVLNEEITVLSQMDSLATTLSNLDIMEESKNYEPLVASQYKSAENLGNYIKGQTSYVEEELTAKNQLMERLEEKSRWLVADADSIPLFELDDVAMAQYLPLVLDSLVTAGVYLSGDQPAQGYMANITPSRVQETKVLFDLNTDYFSKATYGEIKSKSLVLIGSAENIYFVMFYTPRVEEEGFSAIVARANAEGLKWSNEIVLTNNPGDLAYNIQTDEVIINYDVENLEGVGGALVGAKLTLSPKDGKIVDP